MISVVSIAPLLRLGVEAGPTAALWAMRSVVGTSTVGGHAIAGSGTA